jgi:hypothetical protein
MKDHIQFYKLVCLNELMNFEEQFDAYYGMTSDQGLLGLSFDFT